MIKQLLKKIFFACSKSFFLVKGNTKQKAIFLTFDDGPTAGITERIISLLASYNAPATFFTIGRKLEDNFELGVALVEAGHVVANHSLSHQGFSRLSLADQIQQADGAEKIIERLPGPAKRLFRAPQGHWTLKLILRLHKRGYRCVHWSYDSLDYTRPASADIVRQFEQKPVNSGEIILFHDDADVCIGALEVLLPLWKQQGFQFKTISDL